MTKTEVARKVAALKAAEQRAREEREHAWDNAAEIYRERDLLVRALSLDHPSHLMPRAGHQPKHRTAWVVCIHHKTGVQLAWSIPAKMLHRYGHLERTENDWDGHKTADRFDRLEAL